MTDFIDYDSIKDVLERNEIEIGASEAHGLASGLVCADFASSLQTLTQELLIGMDEDDSLVQECRRTLTQMHGIIKEQLGDVEMGYHLLLPDDQHDLPARAKGIVEWCQGFLYGYGLRAGDSHESLSEDALGALEDMGEFTRMNLADLEQLDEDDQQDLVDIEEYLRMAAMTIHADLVSVNEQYENEEELH